MHPQALVADQVFTTDRVRVYMFTMTPEQPEKTSLEDGIVDWDGEDDRANPRNWPKSTRWAHVVVVSILALITYVPYRLVEHWLISIGIWHPQCVLPPSAQSRPT